MGESVESIKQTFRFFKNLVKSLKVKKLQNNRISRQVTSCQKDLFTLQKISPNRWKSKSFKTTEFLVKSLGVKKILLFICDLDFERIGTEFLRFQEWRPPSLRTRITDRIGKTLSFPSCVKPA